MKFFLFSLILISAILEAEVITTKTLNEQELTKMLSTEGALNDEDISSVEDSSKNNTAKTTTSKTYNDDTYEDVATYNMLKKHRSKTRSLGVKYASENKELLYDNVAIYKQKLAELEKKRLEDAKKDTIEEDTIVSLTGYCVTRNEIDIEQIQGYGVLECSFDDNDFNIEESNIFASFIPIPDKMALIAKPVYVQVGRKKIAITNGVILTVDRTSLNVANFINDKKIEKIAGKFMTASAKLALDSSVLYMQQKEASKREENVTYNNSTGGNQVIKTVNTQPPSATDYLVNFGVQLTSAMVSIAGNLMSENNYPLFKVYRGSQFYVDFSIKYNKKNKAVIDYMKKDYTQIKETNTNGLEFNFQLPATSANPTQTTNVSTTR